MIILVAVASLAVIAYLGLLALFATEARRNPVDEEALAELRARVFGAAGRD